MKEIERLIRSESELEEEINKIRSKLEDHELMLLRGQTNFYPTLKSGKSRPNVFVNQEIENGWNSLVGRLLSSKEQPHVPTEMRQAILQHYGLYTHFLDVTSNPKVAAWFACNEYEKLKPLIFGGTSMRFIKRVKYNELLNGFGYLSVLIIPEYKDLIENQKLLDISEPINFLRPKNQNAYLLYDRRPLEPNVNSFWKYNLKIDRTKFRSSYKMRDLFPDPNSDSGYKNLIDVPYVQIPPSILGPSKEEEGEDQETLDSLDHYCFADRAIEITEFIENEQDDGGINHKWGDFVLYEAYPFRTWFKYSLKLEDKFENISGDFCDSSKITVSPQVQKYAESVHEHVYKEWLQIESNDLFFTYSQLDHDKVIDLKPPFKGVWLHREFDLIIATEFSSDGESIKPKFIAAFLLNDGMIKLQEIESIKYPKNRKNLIKRLSGLLSLHGLIKSGQLVFVPHPFQIPKWYVIF